MSQKDGRCPFCSGLLDSSSLTCPSCGRDIFQSQTDDSDRYKIQPRPPSIALTPRNLVIGGVVLLLIVAAPIIAFLSLSKGGGNQPLPTTPIIKTIIVHDQTTLGPTTVPTSILTEVPTPTPSSTSSLALCPNPHPCIAYQEDGSDGWRGWA